MDPVTPATPFQSHEPTAADRERAERIGRKVAEEVSRARVEPLNAASRAVHFWLALESAENTRAARGFVADAMNAAMARLIADESATITPLEDAGGDIRKWLENTQPADLDSAYAGLLAFALDSVDWPRMAHLFAPDYDTACRRIADDVLAIFAEMAAISADGEEQRRRREEEYSEFQHVMDQMAASDMPRKPRTLADW